MPDRGEIYAKVDHALNTGEIDAALPFIDTLLEDAGDAYALTLVGRVMHARGDAVGGLAYLGEAIRVEPYFEPAYRVRTAFYEAMGDPSRAMDDMSRTLLYYPTDIDLISRYVDAAMHSGRCADALKLLERCIKRSPGSAQLSNLEGLTFQRLGRMAEAVASYERAVAIDATQPLFYNNMGTALHGLERYHDARRILETAIVIDGDFAIAWYNLANVHKDQLRFDDAERCYRKAIELRHDYADARLNLACILLEQDQWDEGWAQYEWRWKVPNLLAPTAIDLPRWNGEPIAGKRVVVVVEQGHGDTIQFMRYLPLLHDAGAEILVRCPGEISGLISRMAGTHARVISHLMPLPPSDFYAPLMSLPLLLKTSLATIPAAPYLTAEEHRRAYFAKKLGPRTGDLRIGLVWGGNANQMNDSHRSANLDGLKELFALPGIRWISLQKGQHLSELAGRDLPIEDWNGELDDFDDTAALMQELDGVVSVCSAPVHLAGALGIPTIALLCWAADWRWRLEAERTPWYGSMRLVRQPEPGDWESVAHRAAELIGAWKPRTDAPTNIENAPETKPAPTILATTRYGELEVLRNDYYITSSAAAFGEYCEAELELASRHLEEGSVVVEAGGHNGIHTIPLARFVGASGRVITFEPQRECYDLLKRNIASQHLKNVEIHHAALGALRSHMTLAAPDYHQISNYGAISLDGTGLGNESVDVITIDSLELERCDYIKLDVEGFERAALIGARATIDRHRPYLFVEDDRVQLSFDLRTHLMSLGYRVYRHRSIINDLSTNPLGQTYSPLHCWSLSLFAVPEEKPQPPDLIEVDADLRIVKRLSA